jgi:hypothetical protein
MDREEVAARAPLGVGIAAFDSQRIWHWEGMLRGGAQAPCRVLARYRYGAPEPSPREEARERGLLAPAVWLIDLPAPRLVPDEARDWLGALIAPAVLLCREGGLGRASTPPACRIILPTTALSHTGSLAALLALAASSTVVGGPLYLGGIEAPKHTPVSSGRTTHRSTR